MSEDGAVPCEIVSGWYNLSSTWECAYFAYTTELPPCSIIPPEIDQRKYDFVFDRLRGVRQDLVIAQPKFDVASAAADVLEISVRFHLWANFRCAPNQKPSIFVCLSLLFGDPDSAENGIKTFIGIPSAFCVADSDTCPPRPLIRASTSATCSSA